MSSQALPAPPGSVNVLKIVVVGLSAGLLVALVALYLLLEKSREMARTLPQPTPACFYDPNDVQSCCERNEVPKFSVDPGRLENGKVVSPWRTACRRVQT